jgi:hypothetical protein
MNIKNVIQTNKETPAVLIPALRQCCHNDGKGLLAGFDYDETCKIVSVLEQRIHQLEQAAKAAKLANEGHQQREVEQAQTIKVLKADNKTLAKVLMQIPGEHCQDGSHTWDSGRCRDCGKPCPQRDELAAIARAVQDTNHEHIGCTKGD